MPECPILKKKKRKPDARLEIKMPDVNARKKMSDARMPKNARCRGHHDTLNVTFSVVGCFGNEQINLFFFFLLSFQNKKISDLTTNVLLPV